MSNYVNTWGPGYGQPWDPTANRRLERGLVATSGAAEVIGSPVGLLAIGAVVFLMLRKRR